MFFFCGFLMLCKFWLAEACSANQQSSITLSGNNGTIPKTLGWLPVNATCQWTITAPVGKVLRMNINVTFARKPCGNEYLRFHDGDGEGSDRITEYTCDSGQVIGDYLYSSGHSLWLEVKTAVTANSTSIHLLYQAQDKQECSLNKTLNAPESPINGNFSSPYYPHGFPLNKTCGWYITAPENHIVSLQLTSQLSAAPFSNDSVEVYDVDGSELTAIALFPRLPAHKLYSRSRYVYVVFTTDDKVDGPLERGIFVKYSAVKTARSCASKNSHEENMNILLKDPSGTIKTPGYPYGYSDNLIKECLWKIVAPKGNVVRLEFASFHLNEHDQVMIAATNNGNIYWYIFRRGKQASFTFYSTENELSVEVLKSSSLPGTSGPGFIANYTSVPAVLSGRCKPRENSTVYMSGEGRSFSTPAFPNNPGVGTCSWNITVPLGQFLKLTFWKNFGRCRDNYVEVFDVTDSMPVTLAKFCDKHTEQIVFSRGNKLLVKYFSLRVATSGGFFATYESVKAVPARYSCSKTKYDFIRIDLNATGGEFASYDFPQYYPNNVKCLWAIKSPAEFIVQITFHSFHLQQSRDCQADYVEIKQGQYESQADIIGRFCGSSLPPVVLSNHSNVFVDFVTDISGMYPGFHASYKVLPNPAMGPCKNREQDNIIPLTGVTGSLFSPLYPRDYPHSIMCTWVITVPEGHFVKLRIKSSKLTHRCFESGPTLDIRDGLTSSSNLLKSFCGQKVEPSVFSSGRHLWVRLDSRNDLLDSVSFYALFEAVKQC